MSDTKWHKYCLMHTRQEDIGMQERKAEDRAKCYHSHNGEGGRRGIPLKVRLEALDLVHDLMDAHQLVPHRHRIVGREGHDLLETVVQLDQLR